MFSQRKQAVTNRETCERNRVVHAASALFYRANESLYFGDMLVIGTDVEGRSGICESPAEDLKHAISVCHVDKEATRAVESHNVSNAFPNCIFLSVCNELDCCKLDVVGDCHKEGNLVDVPSESKKCHFHKIYL
jgi:hypothetical protein